MKFKAKIFISFIFLTVVGVILSAFVLYGKMNRMVLGLIEDQIRAVAETTAIFMDDTLVQKVIRDRGQDKEEYRKLKRLLVDATQRNKGKYDLIPFRNIYIVIPSTDPEYVLLVADGFVDPNLSYTFGVPERTSKTFIESYDKVFVSPVEKHNQFGSWFSGHAPITDSRGNYIATLVVEVNSQVIRNELLQTLSYLIAAGMLAILIALIVAGILSHLVTRSLEVIEDGVKKIEKGDYSAQIMLHTSDEFEHLGHSINHMVKGLTERDRLKLGFSRYVSEFVLNKVISSDTHFLDGQRKKITVLFSDIREFTKLAENLAAEHVVKFLNDYFNVMIDVIFKHRGTLDKFMGDGMMVIFGAPLDDDKQEENAVRAAIDMQKAVDELNKRIQEHNIDKMNIGIGIHTGLAVVGNIGSEKRMEYTAIGDTVNIASRIEQLTKNYDAKIIVSADTMKPVQSLFSFQDFGKAQLKGKSTDVSIYGVTSDSSKK